MIKNLKDFVSYREFCPFCKAPLKLSATVGYSPITTVSMQKEKDNYIIRYTGNDNFSQVINCWLDNIILSSIDNTIIFNLHKRNYLSYDLSNKQLNGNRLNIHMICQNNCNSNYMLSLNRIDMDSYDKISFTPSIHSEYFKKNHSKEDEFNFTNFLLLYSQQEVEMKSYARKGTLDISLISKEILPWVNFDFSDPEKMDQKIRMLITLS